MTKTRIFKSLLKSIDFGGRNRFPVDEKTTEILDRYAKLFPRSAEPSCNLSARNRLTCKGGTAENAECSHRQIPGHRSDISRMNSHFIEP
ncbi:hypothetical protein RMSM_02024 [Rhodopirellula maiorica SM1]|uniref:Uncharacterized protein n=1 Tax=Rhodopirellula maiorica SM1 TaxID=1265738 RepID=M5S071_9BACT|nr:hypothetical protein RMSM_02024 [Rhodopirellula maiorica SM1]